MRQHFVICRDCDGHPLKRIAVGESNKLIYIANPERMLEIESGELDAVGFPKSDVFEFEFKKFSGMVDKYKLDQLDDGDWAQLKSFIWVRKV